MEIFVASSCLASRWSVSTDEQPLNFILLRSDSMLILRENILLRVKINESDIKKKGVGRNYTVSDKFLENKKFTQYTNTKLKPDKTKQEEKKKKQKSNDQQRLTLLFIRLDL